MLTSPLDFIKLKKKIQLLIWNQKCKQKLKISTEEDPSAQFLGIYQSE